MVARKEYCDNIMVAYMEEYCDNVIDTSSSLPLPSLSGSGIPCSKKY